MNTRPTPETDAFVFGQLGYIQVANDMSKMTYFARKLERERDEAREAKERITKRAEAMREAIKTASDAIADLLANPYPHDLMAIRKEAEGYFSEQLAREDMEAYCTEEMMLKARRDWQKAQEVARDWLKNNPPQNPIKNENG